MAGENHGLVYEESPMAPGHGSFCSPDGDEFEVYVTVSPPLSGEGPAVFKEAVVGQKILQYMYENNIDNFRDTWNGSADSARKDD